MCRRFVVTGQSRRGIFWNNSKINLTGRRRRQLEQVQPVLTDVDIDDDNDVIDVIDDNDVIDAAQVEVAFVVFFCSSALSLPPFSNIILVEFFVNLKSN